MSNKNEYIKKHEYKTIKLSEIYNDIDQVRKKTAQKDIDKIEDSIKAIVSKLQLVFVFLK